MKALPGVMVFAAVSAFLDVASTYARERHDLVAKIVLRVLRAIWTTATYVIMPDGIGHGRSSKPSDGLRRKFPQYDYADMVEVQHRLVTEKLGVSKLRLILGTSMGCMHGFMWAQTWPGAAQALMPMA